MCLERSEQRGTAGGWGSWANQRVWFLFSRTWKATGGILNKNITRQDLCFKKMTGKVEDDMKRERSRHRVTRSGDKRISNGARTMGLRWRAGSGRLVQASKWNRGGTSMVGMEGKARCDFKGLSGGLGECEFHCWRMKKEKRVQFWTRGAADVQETAKRQTSGERAGLLMKTSASRQRDENWDEGESERIREFRPSKIINSRKKP